MDSQFRDSHITHKHPSSEDGTTKANTLIYPPQGRAAKSKPVQQTRVSVAVVTTAAAKCEMQL